MWNFEKEIRTKALETKVGKVDKVDIVTKTQLIEVKSGTSIMKLSHSSPRKSWEKFKNQEDNYGIKDVEVVKNV